MATTSKAAPASLDWLKRPIAHRGLHDAKAGIIENSASAVEAAIAEGFAIEVDLQCAGDFEPVVFHDATLDRLTSETGPLAARNAAFLAEIALRGTADHILPLTQLLQLVAGRAPLLLEIKSRWSDDRRFEQAIAAQLEDYAGQVAVMSFDPASVAAFRHLAPALPRGLIAGRFDDRAEWLQISRLKRFAMRHLLNAAIAQPDLIAYDIKALPALAPYLARTLFRLPLLTWTVRTDADRAKARKLADGMIFEHIRP